MITLRTDLNLKVSQSTASRCLRLFTRAIYKRAADIIRFPISENDVRDTIADFRAIAGLPYVIGALDCTHVHILRPSDDDAGVYFGRKHYASINVQMTCNARNIITHVNALWPGSCHDDSIFKGSDIYEHLKNSYSRLFLVGDKGYLSTPFLLTPFRLEEHVPDPIESKYNHIQALTRNPIETTFGYLKRRFSIIEKRLDRGPQEASRIVVTCACLHNFAMERGDMFVDNGRVVNLNNDFYTNPPRKEHIPREYDVIRQAGEYVRKVLVNELFVHV